MNLTDIPAFTRERKENALTRRWDQGAINYLAKPLFDRVPIVEPLTQHRNVAPEIDVFLQQVSHTLAAVKNRGMISTVEEIPNLWQR